MRLLRQTLSSPGGLSLASGLLILLFTFTVSLPVAVHAALADGSPVEASGQGLTTEDEDGGRPASGC